MAKLINKWVAGLLAVVMLLGMLPMSVFAPSSNTAGTDQPGWNGGTALTVRVRAASEGAGVRGGGGGGGRLWARGG